MSNTGFFLIVKLSSGGGSGSGCGSGFMLTFAMSLMILLVLKRSTKVSEKSDMTKSWATFCCSGTYKKIKLKCCGI